MDFFTAMEISSSGLSAQRLRMNLIASNLANVNTTRTAQGTPYRRRLPVFVAEPEVSFPGGPMSVGFGGGPFGGVLNRALRRVEVSNIVEDPQPGRQVYDPGNPDANAKGYVTFPNVNVIEEMADLITASRSFEANATAIATFKSMAQKALDIAR